jgi:signal recognition particle subunit SRP54
MQSMGGLGALAGMMPGMKKAKAAMASSGMDERVLLRMDAIIGSMTPKERARPDLLNAKRKIRVAKGSGTQVQDVNKLLKQFTQMQKMMKKMSKGGMAKMMRGLQGRLPTGLPF